VDVLLYFCNTCTVRLLLFCALTNKWGTLLVAQLVEALCYKPEGGGFDSQ